MSKVIVVERCGDCPCIRWTGEKMICCKTDRTIDPLSSDFDKYEAGAGMPDWCPLPDLPERMETKGCYAPESYFRKAIGWNACLDEITGGKKE